MSLLKNDTYLTFNFPYIPISTNRLHQYARGKVFVSPKFKAQKEITKSVILEQMGQDFKPYNEKLEVIVKVYYKKNYRYDVDNMLKSLFDCLNKVLWEDDSQVHRLTIIKIKSEEEKTLIYLSKFQLQ